MVRKEKQEVPVESLAYVVQYMRLNQYLPDHEADHPFWVHWQAVDSAVGPDDAPDPSRRTSFLKWSDGDDTLSRLHRAAVGRRCDEGHWHLLEDAADKIQALTEEVTWWEAAARKHGYCLGCGAPDDGPPRHVRGKRKCCPDCKHTHDELAEIDALRMVVHLLVGGSRRTLDNGRSETPEDPDDSGSDRAGGAS